MAQAADTQFPPRAGNGGRDPFEDAVAVVLQHEGGFVDDPVDPGGATNFGVSLRFLRGLGDLDGDGYLDGDLDRDGDVDAEDIRRMTREQAKAIYRSQWWDRYGYGQLGLPKVAAKVFDLSVNMGAHQAHKCLQRALGSVGLDLSDDGILGPASRRAIEDVAKAARQGVNSEGALLAALRSEAAGFYRTLIAEKPAFAKYRRGWLRRAYS